MAPRHKAWDDPRLGLGNGAPCHLGDLPMEHGPRSSYDTSMPAPADIPRYRLYGEADEARELGFLHVETITARASLHDWTIRPHRHRDLHQVMAVAAGGGVMDLEGARLPFAAPALISTPPVVVHGFEFQPGTEGWVVTLSAEGLAAALAAFGDPALAGVAGRPAQVPLSAEAAAETTGAFAAIEREYRFPQPGRRAAILARLALALVAVARGATITDGSTAGGDAALFARYRDLVEERFRQQPRIGALAAALALTDSRLNAVCRRVAGCSAQEVLHARVLLEAKRSLVYTSMTVAEVAYSLGFADPAYFSRFFARRAGVSPAAYRVAGR
jgi:AraC family transcriptional activator of pobA